MIFSKSYLAVIDWFIFVRCKNERCKLMSADNGVYILVTNRGRRGLREYRVVHCQCIDNLTYNPDFPKGHPQVNLEDMVGRFGKCTVLTDRKIAEGYAEALLDQELEGSCPVCEYGIVWLEFPEIRFPYQPSAAEQWVMSHERLDRAWASEHIPDDILTPRERHNNLHSNKA